MRTLSLCLCLLFFICNGMYAQEHYAVGHVIDDLTGKPIKNVSIEAHTENTQQGLFTSDSTGIFKIPLNLYQKSTNLKLSCLGYKDVVFEIPAKYPKTAEGNIIIIEFRLKPHVIQLEEVVVKERKRYRDTVLISLKDEKFERDIMIDDLFSKKRGSIKTIMVNCIIMAN